MVIKNTVVFYVNSERQEVKDADPEWTLANYVRDHCERTRVIIDRALQCI